MSKPEMPDNAENAIKCSVCGNMILVGSQDGTAEQAETECDICHARQDLRPDRIGGASNEDY